MKNQLAIINASKGIAVKISNFEEFGVNHDLGQAFAFDDQKFIVVTSAQAKAYESVIDRQGFQNYLDTNYSELLGGCLMVEFSDILIGIEEDGYAHS